MKHKKIYKIFVYIFTISTLLSLFIYGMLFLSLMFLIGLIIIIIKDIKGEL